MGKSTKRTRSAPAHARVYAFEFQCPAWQSLSTDAKALLIELRGVYQPSQCGVVFMSQREAMRRLHIGQRRTAAAFSDLIERGWLRVHEPGAFHRKTPHATSYRLTNEPGAEPGAQAPKDYMRWEPSEKTR